MPIRISKSLVSKLPEDQREGLEDYLWAKAGKKCFLCEEPLNRAAEPIEADHDIPEAEGGPNDRDNLNLAHVGCNRAKRAAKSVDVRPYLKLTAAIRKKGGFVNYGQLLTHFGIKPGPSVVERTDEAVELEFPDGSTAKAQVFTDRNNEGDFDYAFVEVPREALFNDDECQPRTIKLPQIWAIYTDVQTNPLHEPPGCRLIPVKGEKQFRLAMFDGQHKTIANWMCGRDTIVAKLYLQITQDQAIRLVNSVQAKIKKLPLSTIRARRQAFRRMGTQARRVRRGGGDRKRLRRGIPLLAF
jgi:hypothetical protein